MKKYDELKEMIKNNHETIAPIMLINGAAFTGEITEEEAGSLLDYYNYLRGEAK